MKTKRDIAIQWFVRLQKMEMDDPERTKFEAWLISDVANQKAFGEVEQLWSKLDSPVAVNQLNSALDQQAFFKEKKSKISASLLSIALVAVAGLLSFQFWQAQPVMQMVATTQLGKPDTKMLEDGSKITLNAHSELEIVYYRNKRTVNLKRGEAIFDVIPDADRPFIVDTDKANITVLGTRFAVNRLRHLVRISVDHGRVKVEANQQELAKDPNFILTDGEVAEVKANTLPKRVNRPASDAFSFEDGFVTFNDADLNEIAETLSRYRIRPIEVANQTNQHAHVTASIKVDNVERFIENLPEMAPVLVNQSVSKTVLEASQPK